jgi:hypothetical protein
MKLSIVTFTIGGRDQYLVQAVNSVYQDIKTCIDKSIKIEHHIILQGCVIDSNTKITLSQISEIESYKIVIHEWAKNIGIGAGLNKIIPQCNGDLIFKMDDDCKIISKDFFYHSTSIHKRFPQSCFNPYPVGLISNAGGPKGFKHSVWWNKDNDNIYTRRHVNHLGGFSRFTPANIVKAFIFPDDLIHGISGSEDGSFSNYCNNNKIEMFYLENKIVVEHNNSTIGQKIKDPDYFKSRTNESQINVQVLY